MTTVTFKTGITDEQAEEVFKKMEAIMKRGHVYSSDKPTKDQQSKFHELLYQFYCLPKTDLHDQWEEFRNPVYKKLRDTLDEAMLESVQMRKKEAIEESEYNEAVILRMDTIEDLKGKIDFCLVCAKEFGLGVDRGEEKFGRTKEINVYKSKHPKTFERLKANLRKRSYNTIGRA